MLGQTVVAAIIYGFVGTDWTTLPNRLQPGPKLPSSVISDRAEAYLAMVQSVPTDKNRTRTCNIMLMLAHHASSTACIALLASKLLTAEETNTVLLL